jgi:hypothetical protein
VTGLSQSFASKDVKGAGGSTLQVDAGYTIHDGNSGGNYDVHTHTATGTISPKNLTISGAVANDKTYDANDTATINWTNAQLNGVVTGDTVSIDHSAYAAHFADKNVGTNKPVTVTGVGLTGSDSGDYTVSQPSGLTASISKAPLDISAVSDSKTYDGTTTSTGTPTLGTGQLQGTDSVTGLSQSFTSKDVKGAGGSTLQVDAGYTIHDGNNGGNYNVTTHTATGTITKASLDIYAVTDSKIYDGTTASSGIPTVTGLQGSDTVANKTQAFQSKNVLGAGNSTLVVSTYTVNDGNSGGNYNVTTHNASGTITARSITVTAQPDTKTYDATTSSSVMPKVTTGTIAAGDTGNFTQAFATKTAGSNKTLTPSGSVSDTNSGHNYAVTFTNNTNGVITPAPLTVTGITANNKVWDGTTAASLNTGGASLVGVLSNDVVTLNTGGATGTFSTSSVGTWPVSVSGLTITGNDSGNYMLTQPSTTASISAWTAAGKGFYAPVGVANSIFTAAPAGPPTIFNSGYVWNTVKGGQTVPLKFNVFAGSVEKTGADAFTNIATAFQAAKMTSCTIAADTDPVDYTITATGSTTLRYDPTGMQWIYNWQTPKVSATTCYRTYVTFADGSSLEAFFQLGK